MTLQTDLIALARMKKELSEMADEVAELEANLVAGMKAKKVHTVTADDLKGTLVEATRIVIDDDILEKEVGPAMWKKITKPVLDKEKLEAYIATGQIDTDLVARCSIEKANKPYVRVTGSLDVPTPGVKARMPRGKR